MRRVYRQTVPEPEIVPEPEQQQPEPTPAEQLALVNGQLEEMSRTFEEKVRVRDELASVVEADRAAASKVALDAQVQAAAEVGKAEA